MHFFYVFESFTHCLTGINDTLLCWLGYMSLLTFDRLLASADLSQLENMYYTKERPTKRNKIQTKKFKTAILHLSVFLNTRSHLYKIILQN